MSAARLAAAAGVVVAGASAVAPLRAVGAFVAVAAAFGTPGWLALGRDARRTPEGLALGWALGVAAVSCAVFVLALARVPMTPAVAAGVVAGAAFVGAARGRRAAAADAAAGRAWRVAPPGGWGVAAGLAGLVLLTHLPVLSTVAAPAPEGATYTRFFNADFFKHMAYTFEVARGTLPPVDPYAPDGVLHYYWGGYLMPGAALRLGGAAVGAGDVLLAQGLWQSVALLWLIWGALRRRCADPRVAAALAAVGYLSLTPDALVNLARYAGGAIDSLGGPLANLIGNDPLFALGFPKKIYVSHLYRLGYYLQTHQLATLLFAAWLFLAAAPGRRFRASDGARALLVAPLLPISVLLGAVAGGAALCGEVARGVIERRARGPLAVAAALAAGAAACVAFGYFGGSAWWTEAKAPPPLAVELITGVLGLGRAALLYAGLGAFALVAGARALRPGRVDAAAAPPAAAFVCAWGSVLVSQGFMWSGASNAVEIKASFVALVALPLAAAPSVARAARGRGLGVLGTLGVAALVAGAPTPVMDLWWHRQTRVPGKSTFVPGPDRAALRFLRAETAPDAVVAQYPFESWHEGEPDSWVPVFAGRRVRAARRGTNLTAADIARAEALYSPPDGAWLHRECRAWGIDYLLIQSAQPAGGRAALAAAMRSEPARFRRVFADGPAEVWRVRREGGDGGA